MNRETLDRILDLARWAPSGDNTQPWRFEIIDDRHIAIHGHDTRDHVLYDFSGHPSHMAHGALLETLRIGATGFQLAAQWSLRPHCPDTAPIYDVILSPKPELVADPLLPFIETRAVQRRPMRSTPLSESQRRRLSESVGPEFTVQYFSSWRERLAMAGLLWDSAFIRLSCPEALPVHRDIIEWGARFSADRIPERALGIDPLTGILMKWAMQSWQRVAFFNRYLMGTVFPRIQMDFVPALACAAHLLLRPRQPPAVLLDHVRAGIALQRLWLTAAACGLHLQPLMAPVIFRWYVRAGTKISAIPEIDRLAKLSTEQFEEMAAAWPDDGFSFLCRVGQSRLPWSRSLRQKLDDLMLVARPNQ